MPAWVCGFFLTVLLLAEVTNGARISQRLVGGHAKVEASSANKNNDEAPEEKKTLSQQVAEGKYGLIQKELFEKQPKRLGVLSYEKNGDVPKDNENSLGGLGPDEIWLAEDHLLVLRGGSFHRTASELPWPPIDDYRAPNRQVKIPSQPKVPPPFPVQLSEGGPLQFLGINITRAPNGSLTIPGADGAPPFFLPLPSGGPDTSNASAGRPAFPIPPYIIGEGPENFNRGNGPGPFPFPFPPPPSSNLNQSFDEDDPSIYYPPPYSFFYPKDNTSKVPAGPLVPGIVLPPPPDFFAPLDPETTTSFSTTATTTTNAPASSRLPLPPQRTHIIVTSPPETQRPPIRYLPYDDSTKQKITHQPNVVNIIPSTVPTKPHLINFHEVPYDENELTHTKPATPTIGTIPVLRIPNNDNVLRPKPYVTSSIPPRTETPIFRIPYHNTNDERPRTRLRPTTPPQSTTPTVYFSEEYEQKEKTPSRVMMPPYAPPTLSSIPVLQAPKTYLRPTTINPISNSIPQAIPVVQISYGGGNNDHRPRTYLKPASGSSISNTASPVPVLQVPFNDQRPRTYLRPTGGPYTSPISVLRPTGGPLTSPISVQYLPYNSNNKNRVKPTAVPVIRSQVSSTAVPLKSYYSDVNTNSVQPHAEYYYYEEDSTPPPQSAPQRLRYVAPTNFEKHIQQLRQQIQSYLKPTARPVYEYSFQAANYRPTKPPTRYLTPAPPQQQYNQYDQRPIPSRYQQQEVRDQQAYYTKQDERLLDDITKKYFTVFGQKITTPGTPQLSLAGDTLINYRKPRPPINHEAEYIHIRPQQPLKQTPGEPGTFISYALPGEGAHFYFLTPQLVQQQRQQQQRQQQQQQHHHQQQQQQEEQQNAYYYEKPENPSRIRRRNQR